MAEQQRTVSTTNEQTAPCEKAWTRVLHQKKSLKSSGEWCICPSLYMRYLAGDFLQGLAPIAKRVLGNRLFEWAMKRYYGLS
ncbi:MAG: hypothetical protein AAFN81_22620 [Bacteroidota bacterium]